jgi:hypothetical protein
MLPAPSGSGASAAPLVLTDAAGARVAPADLSTQASVVVTIRNAQTGLCLDSNYAGNVYTLGRNGGNYQRWPCAVHPRRAAGVRPSL